jgi:DNA-binding MarR family transcriptional regulator
MYKQLMYKKIDLKNIARSIIIMGIRIEIYANKHVFEPLGLTASGYKIMAILYHNKGTSPVEMLERLGCSKSNITQRLNLLERKKLITRLHDKNNADKRKIIIKLTKLGEKKYSELLEIMDRRSHSIEKYFSKDEMANYVTFLKKLHKIMSQMEKSNSLIKII